MKNIKIKNLGCGVLCSCLLSFSAQAQTCQAAPSCQDLGFNKTAAECAGISSLKCPLDENYMFCPGNSWIFDFIGTGEPQVGSIIYSDGTINTALVQNKTPIAVVFDVENQLAVAFQNIHGAWMDTSNPPDVPGNPTLDIEEAKKDMDGKKNTLTISEYCKTQKISCPAIEWVLSYAAGIEKRSNGETKPVYQHSFSGTLIEGAGPGQWFMPSAGQLISLVEKTEILNPIIESIWRNYGGELFASVDGYWSSTEAETLSGFRAAHCITRKSSPALYNNDISRTSGCLKSSSSSTTSMATRPIMHFELKK